jgi:hypothetical protein
MHGAVTPLPQYVFMAPCLVKHRDDFIFLPYTYIAIVSSEVARFRNPMKVKVKLSLCLTEHHAMKAYWGVEV